MSDDLPHDGVEPHALLLCRAALQKLEAVCPPALQRSVALRSRFHARGDEGVRRPQASLLARTAQRIEALRSDASVRSWLLSEARPREVATAMLFAHAAIALLGGLDDQKRQWVKVVAGPKLSARGLMKSGAIALQRGW
jgi:hypothetical protein